MFVYISDGDEVELILFLEFDYEKEKWMLPVVWENEDYDLANHNIPIPISNFVRR